MADSRFVYVTYIRTTPEKLWQALIEPEFTRQFWCETWQESEWKPGASWRLMLPNGRVGDSGEVLEIEPGRKLVLKWRNDFMPALHAEGYFQTSSRTGRSGKVSPTTIIKAANPARCIVSRTMPPNAERLTHRDELRRLTACDAPPSGID
jgi:uncharacterized protein YndB with AHSA1/START domain